MHYGIPWAAATLGGRRARTRRVATDAAAPDEPAFADTLGALLLDAGVADRAAMLLRAAHEARPTDPSIGYRCAAALVATGDTASARRLLLGITTRQFPEQQAALALLERLR